MRRVFVNLIDNALDALANCDYERAITITTRPNSLNESVTIGFTDNGSGIAPEDYENLFFPYSSPVPVVWTSYPESSRTPRKER